MRRYVAMVEAALLLAGASLVVLIGAPAALARFAYVSNFSRESVTPVNLATNVAGTPIKVGSFPWGVAITPDGKTAYVSSVESGSVTPINVATNTAGTPIMVGSRPEKLGITPDGRTAYIPDEGEEKVTPINVATNTAGTPITVGRRPTAVAVTPDGKTAYITNLLSSSVTPINVATNTPGTPIAVGVEPEGIAITPDGKTAYVTNHGSGNVTPINVATNTAGTPITVGTHPEGIAITPDGKSAYVTNFGSASVTPINVATDTAGTPITVGGEPLGIAITPDGKSAYVANGPTGALTPIGLASNTAGTPIMLGGEPIAVAIVPDSGTAAAFSASAAPAGQATSFDGSASSDPEGSVTSYAWSFGDGTSATTSSPKLSHVYARPGSYTATLKVTDNEGCSSAFLFTGQTAYCSAGEKAVTTRVLSVAPAPSTPTRLSAPTISGAHQSASRWREGNKLAQISRPRRRPPIGTTFSFSLNEQASVSFTFAQELSGRKLGRRCVAKTPKNAKRKRCTRSVTAGSLSFTGHAGTTAVGFQGRLSPSKRLARGRYTLSITATNSAGARSAPVSLSFTIVR